MRQSVETTNGLERKMTVSVPAGSLSRAFEEHVRSTATDLKLPGFRPGKVPLKVVRQRFGSKLLQEVGSGLVQKTLEDAVQAEALTLAGSATIDIITMADGQDLEYTATFEVFPDIQLAPFDTLLVRLPKTQIEDADIDRTVEDLRRQKTQWLAVERPAQLGDRVLVDQVFEADGETLEKQEQGALVLSDEADITTTTIIGMAAGETGAYPVPIPLRREMLESSSDDPDEADEEGQAHEHGEPASDSRPEDGEEEHATASAADAPEADAPEADGAASTPAQPPDAVQQPPTRHVIGTVTLHRVEEPHLPALDDTFFDWFDIAKEGDRMAAFRSGVRERMDVELDAAMRRATQREVLDALVAAHEFDVPKVLVEAEAARSRQRFAAAFGTYPQAMESAVRSNAEKDVRQALVVQAIARQESLEVDDKRVAARIDEVASGYEQAAEVRRFLFANEERLQNIEAGVLQEQVVEKVLEAATVQRVEMPYAEVVANAPLPPAPAPAEDATEGAVANAQAELATATEDAPTEDAASNDTANQPAAPSFVGKLRRRLFGGNRDA